MLSCAGASSVLFSLNGSRFWCRSAVVFLLLGYACGVFAQSADPEGLSEREWQRQQERERVLRELQVPRPRTRPTAPAIRNPGRLPTKPHLCFPIRRIELKGEGSERFGWAVAAAELPGDPAIGRCLGEEGINRVMKRIQNAVIARGFVTTRVRIEPQNLNDGVLALTVIPGRIHAIRFTKESGHRANYHTALPARPGDLLNLRDTEQALENFKRVPTAEADIQIVPTEGAGAKPGESDLLIAWRQAFPLRLSLSLDDSGAKETGRHQAGFTLSVDNPFGLNDLFYVNVNQDADGDSEQHGTRGQSIYYGVPLGYWRLSFSASRYKYHQAVAGNTQTYRYSGKSKRSELELSRMLHRDAVSKTEFNTKAWVRASRNYVDDTEVEIQRRRMAGWGMGIQHTRYFGAATLTADLDYRRGTGAFGSLPAPEEAFDEGTSRPRYVTAKLDYSLPFRLGARPFSYHAEYRGQWNGTPLIPQDRFALGGRYTVRGFDGERQLSGDRGWLLRNEFGMAVGGGCQLYLGLDYGAVSGPSSEQLVGDHLAGNVLGLRGGYKGFSYDFFVGGPLNKPDGFVTDTTVSGFSLYWTV